MRRVIFRLYAELNDNLVEERRMRPFEATVPDTASVGDALRALGVSRDAVDVVLVNGAPAGLDHSLADGDRVAAYPVFEAWDVSQLVRGRPRPLREPRFAVERNLGRLAIALRTLGFDTSCIGLVEPGRIALSTSPAPRGASHWLRLPDERWRSGLRLLVERLHLDDGVARPARCLRCNELSRAGIARCPACKAQLRSALRRCLHPTYADPLPGPP